MTSPACWRTTAKLRQAWPRQVCKETAARYYRCGCRRPRSDGSSADWPYTPACCGDRSCFLGRLAAACAQQSIVRPLDCNQLLASARSRRPSPDVPLNCIYVLLASLVIARYRSRLAPFGSRRTRARPGRRGHQLAAFCVVVRCRGVREPLCGRDDRLTFAACRPW